MTPLDLVDRWAGWLADWPVPFPTLADVRDYFGAERRTEGEFFVEVMSSGLDGWRPLAHADHVLATLAHWAARDHRPELAAVTCPALVVAGAQSDQRVDRQREMAELRSTAAGPWCRTPATFCTTTTSTAGGRPSSPSWPADRPRYHAAHAAG